MKGKGRGKRKTPAATGYDSDENCTMCNGHYVNGEDWIAVIYVAFGTTESVQIYRMKRSGVVSMKVSFPAHSVSRMGMYTS